MEWNGVEQRFHSIVWILYDGMELISHSIVWKVDGMELVIIFLFHFYPLLRKLHYVEFVTQFNQYVIILILFISTTRINISSLNFGYV